MEKNSANNTAAPTAKNIRERRTIDVMIGLYCKHHHDGYDKQAHGEAALCPECRELAAYVDKRIEHCPLGEAKTTCKDCPVHCYSDTRREQIREVMRYAGPRLLFTHPVLTFHHMKDGLRKSAEPLKPTGSAKRPAQDKVSVPAESVDRV